MGPAVGQSGISRITGGVPLNQPDRAITITTGFNQSFGRVSLLGSCEIKHLAIVGNILRGAREVLGRGGRLVGQLLSRSRQMVHPDLGGYYR